MFDALRLFILEAIMKKFDCSYFSDISKKAGISLFLKHLKYDGNLIKDVIYKVTDIDKNCPYQQHFYNVIYNIKETPVCKICGKKKVGFENISKGYYKNNICSLKCANANPERQEKIANTNLRNLGVRNVFQDKGVQEKSAKTNIKKYGKPNVSQVPSIRRKAEATMTERYGAPTSYQSPELMEKMQNACFVKHGFYNISHSKEHNDKKAESIRKTFFIKLINSDRLKSKVKPLFNIDEYKGVKGEKYPWECLTCGTEFLDHIDNSRVPRCFICEPRQNNYASKYEYEIIDFIKSIYNDNAIQGDRTVIPPLELDIYVPDKKLAIEFNGLYWHSEIGGEKDKNYHYNKYKECKDKGVALISIFEDEWLHKQDIIKSIIACKLGVVSNKINARDCEVNFVESSVVSKFLNDNHIQGSIQGKINICLMCKGEIVSCMVMGTPRFSNDNQYEILRFCSKKNMIVRGALSKLYKSFIVAYNPESIITYSDLRFGSGNGYVNLGFEYKNTSTPNYYYMEQYNCRQNRMKFQKGKLSTVLNDYDESLTEWQNMQLNGYDRIWDCGNSVYEYKR